MNVSELARDLREMLPGCRVRVTFDTSERDMWFIILVTRGSLASSINHYAMVKRFDWREFDTMQRPEALANSIAREWYNKYAALAKRHTIAI